MKHQSSSWSDWWGPPPALTRSARRTSRNGPRSAAARVIPGRGAWLRRRLTPWGNFTCCKPADSFYGKNAALGSFGVWQHAAASGTSELFQNVVLAGGLFYHVLAGPSFSQSSYRDSSTSAYTLRETLSNFCRRSTKILASWACAAILRPPACNCL